jgi:polysaccharide deacetylase family protein (PEP-CTERM system associated)
MPSFLLTIDVEDWFQVENLRPWIPFSTWDSQELRVEANVHKLLDLFDDVKLDTGSRKPEAGSLKLEARNRFSPSLESINSTNPICLPDSTISQTSNLQLAPMKKVRCTFFILGWIAKRLPHLVREIAARGHEVASHGQSHRMCNGLAGSDLRSELGDSKHLLEDITGKEVAGFRAPNFSIDDRVLSILQESGYRYDSSYNSFSLHGRYGKISLNGNRAGIAHRIADNFFELPVSNLPLSTLVNLGTRSFRHFPLPWGGGAYFRIMPLSVFTTGVRSILKKDGAYTFYMHPWEFDSGQPKVGQASLGSRFKHYSNISKTVPKLKKLIESFSRCRFVTCRDYLKERARQDCAGSLLPALRTIAGKTHRLTAISVLFYDFLFLNFF